MLPALLIAQRVYQDGSRADELVTRNQVRNPLSCRRRPGGAALMATVNENLITLVVGGQAYGGWKSLEVERGIEQLAGEFQLTLTHRWPGEDAPIGLREGLPCEVKFGQDLLITGYIDTIDIDLTDTSCRLSVSGRDKTGDLVDSSAIHGSGQWKNVRLEQIVRDICKPFGIEVLVQTDTGEAISSFSLDDGEKAFDAIDRAARSKAILVSSSPAGQLVLTVPARR